MSNVQNEYAWKVCVRCLTFNHAPYIEDAMNGFCMQETDFPFVCTIVDDASTDGNQEVIKKYLEEHFDLEEKSVVRNEETEDYTLTFAKHKTNRNCYFAVLYLKYNYYSIKKDKMPYIAEWHENSKYIALCEGDDYWIDEKKLQMQVDFLEKNTGYSMCFHRAKIIKEENFPVGLRCDDIEDREYNPNELFKEWKVPTASIVLRHDYLEPQNVGTERILNGDIVIVLNCAKKGKIRGFSDVMSVYRVQGKGVTYDKELYNMRMMRYPGHYEFIKENYSFIDSSLVNYKIAQAYIWRRKVQTSWIDKIKDVIWAFYYKPTIFKDKLNHIVNKR